MADETLEVLFKGTDQLTGTLSKVTKLAGGALVAGLGAATGAAIAFGTKAVQSFIGFEDQLNEVFTLMPDLTEQAMDSMQADLLSFTTDVGRTTEEVIPALYQSISAGVPPENVFDFLETAHAAALGGVTELETAVDGISSVVNAYGSEVIDATGASDLMFTSVRLGKTTFGELATTLSNVTPLASALNLGFDNLTAAIATMTSQGTDTATATVQLRGILTELGKEGSIVSDIFEEAADVTFQEFINQGGNLAGALQILADQSEETGVPLQNMFGNVRAGLGALQLTGSGMESFVSNLEEMAEAGGATQTAYDRMNSGMARTFEVLGARFEALKIRAGEALAPIAEIIGEKIGVVMDNLMPIIEGAANAVGTFITHLESGVPFYDALQNFLNSLLSLLPLSETQYEDWGEAIFATVEWIRDLVAQIREEVIPAITEFITPIIEAIANFVSWKDVAIALAAGFAAIVIPAVVSLAASIAPVVAAIAAIIGIIALLRNAWENDWGGIRTKLTEIWEGTIQPALSELMVWLQENIPVAIAELKRWWEEELLPAIDKVWAFIQDSLIPLFDELAKTYIALIQKELEIMSGIWQNVLLPALEDVWAWIQDKIMPIFTTVWEFVRDRLSPVIDQFSTIIQLVWERIGGLSGAVETVIGWLRDFRDMLANIQLPDWMTPGSPMPLETAFWGLGEAIRSISTQDLPRLRIAADLVPVQQFGASPFSAFGGSPTSEQTVYNEWNFNIRSDQPGDSLLQDYYTARSLVGGS